MNRPVPRCNRRRSCVGCHGAENPKAGFNLTARETLLRGGQSGEPPIVPGYAAESPLLRYVADQVEDLEMPPLNRRKKYPALSAEEIERLRTWIDGGALWPAPAPTKAAAAVTFGPAVANVAAAPGN